MRCAVAIGSLLVFTVLAAAPIATWADEPRGADESQPIHEGNLLENERDWPYQVALVGDWHPAGRAAPLPAGSRGVLVRVEPAGLARIDFGRNGRHSVPVAVTDLVERANRVRRGELRKMMPNFQLAIGTKLMDSDAETLRPFRHRDMIDARGALCVFADPTAGGFAALVAALDAFRSHSAVLTIFFPIGDHSDAEVRERLRSLKWPVPFVFDRYAEAFMRSLVGDEISLPALLLQTMEGRLLWHGAWSAEAAPALALEIDAVFGAASDDDPGG
jgi:hypothetical protein